MHVTREPGVRRGFWLVGQFDPPNVSILTRLARRLPPFLLATIRLKLARTTERGLAVIDCKQKAATNARV